MTQDRLSLACKELIKTQPLLTIPAPVLAEAGYLISKIVGIKAEAAFLRSLRSNKFSIESPTKEDLTKAADLIEKYADLDIGTTDAIVMAMAENRNEPRIATLDQRHFTVVKPESFQRFVTHPI